MQGCAFNYFSSAPSGCECNCACMRACVHMCRRACACIGVLASVCTPHMYATHTQGVGYDRWLMLLNNKPTHPVSSYPRAKLRHGIICQPGTLNLLLLDRRGCFATGLGNREITQLTDLKRTRSSAMEASAILATRTASALSFLAVAAAVAGDCMSVVCCAS